MDDGIKIDFQKLLIFKGIWKCIAIELSLLNRSFRASKKLNKKFFSLLISSCKKVFLAN